MRIWSLIFVFILVIPTFGVSQTRRPAARKTSPPAHNSGFPGLMDRGKVSGRTYENKTLDFTVTFPDTWLIPGDDFVAYMKKAGFDIAPKPPKAANPADQHSLDLAFSRLKILLTAYRSIPGTEGNAVARVAAETLRGLNTNRPVKDAVDYVDLMRSQMRVVKMPAGYTYSETQAEQLGTHQFAYIDSEYKTQKTRVYVTVRRGYAILFSLNYSVDTDLETFRDTLARAHFSIK